MMAFLLGFSALYWGVVLTVIFMTAVVGPGGALVAFALMYLVVAGQALVARRREP